MEIKDAVFLVTGGSSGIGKATAKKLVEAGGKVVITGRDEEKLNKTAHELGVIPITADAGTKEGVEKTFRELKEQTGRLDCLINNAGIGYRKPLDDITWEDFETIHRVNVYGAAMMAQKAAEIFKSQNYGNIVNISSTAGTKGSPEGTVYCSSKFALRGMTQCWQAELRPYNVRVILINPSEVTTAFGDPERKERPEEAKKLRSEEIAHSVFNSLTMDDRGFIPELTVFATNPW